MGVGKYTPNGAVHGYMGWQLATPRQGISVTRQWCRMMNLVNTRSLNKDNYRVKNWCRVCTFYTHLNLQHLCNQNYNFETRSVIKDIGLVLDEYYE